MVIFPPAKVGNNGIARFEFLGARFEDLADSAALKGFAQLKGHDI
jgi:hypothetical protein